MAGQLRTTPTPGTPAVTQSTWVHTGQDATELPGEGKIERGGKEREEIKTDRERFS